MEYALWKQMVETVIYRRLGLDSEAIPDFDYTKAYENGWTPTRTATAAIAAARRF
jgi:hypothetical protein